MNESSSTETKNFFEVWYEIEILITVLTSTRDFLHQGMLVHKTKREEDKQNFHTLAIERLRKASAAACCLDSARFKKAASAAIDSATWAMACLDLAKGGGVPMEKELQNDFDI